MTKLLNISRRLFPVVIMAAVSLPAAAQNYYDDDIYYDASKKKTEKTEAKNKQTSGRTSQSGTNRYAAPAQGFGNFNAADTYELPASSLDVDVDAYNRRGQFLVSDSVGVTEQGDGDFLYTQRIERFHNPDVVSGSSDEELKDVYAYAMQQPQNINVYVIDNDPWSWYGPSWSWRYGNPWYWNTWGPSWSWSWGIYDPYWSWGPAWGPSWGWSWSFAVPVLGTRLGSWMGSGLGSFVGWPGTRMASCDTIWVFTSSSSGRSGSGFDSSSVELCACRHCDKPSRQYGTRTLRHCRSVPAFKQSPRRLPSFGNTGGQQRCGNGSSRQHGTRTFEHEFD